MKRIPDAIKGVLLTPKLYFKQLPAASGYRDNLIMLGIFLFVPSLIMVRPAGSMAVLLYPFALGLMLASTWLWARYLTWAVRIFSKEKLDPVDAFQICACSSAPMIFAWTPVLNVIMTLWNFYLTWRGLVSFARIRGGVALLILFVPLVIFAASLLILFGLLFYLMTGSGITPRQIPNLLIF